MAVAVPGERRGAVLGPVVVRARSVLWTLRAIGFAFAAATAGLSATPLPDESKRALVVALGAGGGLVMALFTYRVGWAAVRVSTTGIRVRNPFRGHSLAWDEIERFAVRREGNGAEVATVHTNSGRVISAFGIQGPTRVLCPRYGGVERRVAWLNERLAEAHRGGPLRLTE